MHKPPKTRATRLATLGGVAALASLMAYAGQSLVDWRSLKSDPVQTTSAGTGPQATPNRSGVSRRSALLRSGTVAQQRAAREMAIEKSPQTERQIFGRHLQKSPLDASRRMPLQPTDARWMEATSDINGARDNLLRRPSLLSGGKNRISAAVANTCSSSQFASLSGQALVTAVTDATTDCINELFSLSGTTAANTFSEAKMATIANGLASVAGRYDGTNRDGALQLILFLRAGYYVQFYDPAVGNYGSTLKNAMRPALDAFSNNANFGLVNNVHGEVLAEFVTLIDSASENARYLSVVKRLLDSYSSSYDAYFWMLSAVNNAYMILFRGHQNSDFQQLVQSDNSIVDTLYGFANRNFNMMGGTNDYLVSNAGRELARFLQYTGSLKSIASSRVKALLDRSSVTGVTAPLWVGLGEMVEYYDSGNCSYYSLCDFKARVESAALPLRHTCSSTLTIRAQAMSSAELANTCSVVGGQETYFHDMLQTGRTPVAGDNNSALEMVVFNSSTDYGTYAGAIFGIDTNNGGMYLEGSPSAAGNQARFIAYEAEWLQPAKFEIWNLTHEYVHYLDGRFNMFGDFSTYMAHATVWWIEGFAEFMSYSYRNVAYTAAQQEAAKATYNLSTIFSNDYNSGQTRVYNWGYLAVRYMFERRQDQVNTVLGYVRPGNYASYDSFMRSIATGNDADFRAWLPCVAQPGSCGGTANKPPVSAFTTAVSGLGVQFTDGSSDPDGSIVSRAWNFGDGGTSTATNPSRSYAASGTYTVRLTVTDDKGATATSTQQVTVTATQTNKPPVAAFTAAVNGLGVQFTDGSSDPDGSIVSRAWNFGDGGTSTAANPSRSYAASGTYTVRLTVTDDKGATATSTQQVTVSAAQTNKPPVAAFTTSANGLAVQFSDGSSDPDGSIASRVWTFGDGGSSAAANPSHVYAAVGTYMVQLKVTDNSGATATVQKAVTVASSGGLPECTGSPEALGRNCVRSNVSVAARDYAYMYVYVPQGVTSLRITTKGGSGNADLYVNSLGSWATRERHNYRSTNAGNDEKVVVNYPPPGYLYISLYGATAAQGVSVSVEY